MAKLDPPLSKPGDFIGADLEERWQALYALALDNQEHEQALRPYGAFIPVLSALMQRTQFARMVIAERTGRPQSFAPHPDLETTLAAMVESLIDVVLPFDDDREHQEDWLAFEERYHKSLSEFLAKARGEVVQAKLAEGSQLSPQMIRLMHKQMQRIQRPADPQGNGGGLIIPGQG